MNRILRIGIMAKEDMERRWISILTRGRPEGDPQIWLESVEEIHKMFSAKSLDLLRSLEEPKSLAELVQETGRREEEIELALLAFSSINLVESFACEKVATCYRRLADRVQVEVPLSHASSYSQKPKPDKKGIRRWILRRVNQRLHSREKERAPENETPQQRWERICAARAWVYSCRAGVALDRYEMIAQKTHDEETKRQYEEVENVDSGTLKQIYWKLSEDWTRHELKWRKKAQCFDRKTGKGIITHVPTGQKEPTLCIGPSILERIGADWDTVFQVETDGRSIILTPVEEVDDAD